MNILILGMEMPHDCDECRLCTVIPVGDYGIYRKCLPLNANAEITIRRADCPLVPVPPHGRLIDADELTLKKKIMLSGMGFTTLTVEAVLIHDIENAPTIIPAEEGE